jgi:hypothetical protein
MKLAEDFGLNRLHDKFIVAFDFTKRTGMQRTEVKHLFAWRGFPPKSGTGVLNERNSKN